MLCCHSATLSGHLPPNSLAAVCECVEARVPRLEVDVRFMADDSMLIFHDSTLDQAATGAGVIAALSRRDVRSVRYRRDENHGLCFLEDVVDLMRGSGTLLQVDLKLMRPISPGRAAALKTALAPLGDQVIVGSQAHWNLRQLAPVPVAFDPTLQWHYNPARPVGAEGPRAMGVHGLWDDAPLAAIRHASAGEYIESRIRDLRGLLPAAVEWMVDIQTVLRLAELGVPLGERLRDDGCALASWTVREDTPARAAVVRRLFESGTETIITDCAAAVASDAAALLELDLV